MFGHQRRRQRRTQRPALGHHRCGVSAAPSSALGSRGVGAVGRERALRHGGSSLRLKSSTQLLRAPVADLVEPQRSESARSTELKGVRRGHISTAGLIKGRRSQSRRRSAERRGRAPLAPRRGESRVGDVSDENADDDGALLAAGYASFTPIRGPREVQDLVLDDVMDKALDAMSRRTLDRRLLVGTSPLHLQASAGFFFSRRGATFAPFVGLVARRGVRGVTADRAASARVDERGTCGFDPASESDWRSNARPSRGCPALAACRRRSRQRDRFDAKRRHHASQRAIGVLAAGTTRGRDAKLDLVSGDRQSGAN